MSSRDQVDGLSPTGTNTITDTGRPRLAPASNLLGISVDAQMAAALTMPLLSQQIIQDAFSMCTPVLASDEPLLLQTLLQSRKRKENYKDALNGLHGVSY